MAVWPTLVLSIAGVALLAALAFFWAFVWARRARATQQQLHASESALSSLQASVAELRAQVARQGAELSTRPEQALVITNLGSEPAERPSSPRPTITLRPTVGERVARGSEQALASFLARPSEVPHIVRRVVDRGAVRLVSLGFGVVRALGPEARDRIEFASRAGMRRSRRQREREVRLARRLIRSGHVTVSEER